MAKNKRERAVPADGSQKGCGAAQIMIVDDHPIVRHGLVQVIDQDPELEVCAELADARSALAAVEEEALDLAIVDLSLQDIGGLELIKQMRVRVPDLPVLVLSMHDETLYAERALRAGARGYIMKQAGSEKLFAAIRTVLSGEMYLSERMASQILGKMAGSRPGEATGTPLNRLSDRELEIFEWLGRGLGTRQIAERLCVSVKTVESHREHIKDKLDLHRAADLVQHATHWVMRET